MKSLPDEITTGAQYRPLRRAVFALALIIGASILSIYNYLLFHSVVEIFSIVVAFAIFAVAWNTRSYHDNDYLIFIGIAYFFIGGIDLLHTLAYEGMGVFPAYGSNLPTQLWILGRYLEATSLFVAPLFFTRKLNYKGALTGYSLASLLLLLSIFWGIFPDCFVAGSGLTTFKVVSEYVISGMLLGAIYFLARFRDRLERSTFYLLTSSLLLTVFAELFFTFYVSVYGISNLIGHLFKLGSFYLIYLALINTGLREPYKLMFKELKDNKERYQSYFEELGDAIFILSMEKESYGKILDVNTSAEEQTGYSREELIGMNLIENLAMGKSPEMDYEDASEKLSRGETVSFIEQKRRKDGSEYWTEVVVTPLEHEGKQANLSINRDITERVRAQQDLEEERGKLKHLHSAVDQLQQLDDEESILETVVAVAEGTLGFETCGIMLLDGDYLVPKASSKDLDLEKTRPFEVGEGVVGKSFERGETIWGDDARNHPDAKPTRESFRSFICVPIGQIGSIQIISEEVGRFNQSDVELTEILAGHLREELKRVRLEVELRQQAIHDPLTGLYNRRYFNETLSKEVERSERYGHNIAFLMIDVNRFKEVNDRYSHQIGDKVLEEVARLVRENVREADTVVRYGGDEFLIMQPETNGASKHTVSRLRRALDAWNEESDLLDFSVTLAIGVSHWSPDQERNVEEALKEADQKMYEDKGR